MYIRLNSEEHAFVENVIFQVTTFTKLVHQNKDSLLFKEISNKIVETYRPGKEKADAFRPYSWIHEEEVQKDASLQKVNTIFLTNRECPFKCTMCDLWRHTLDVPTPPGAIPAQIEFAQKRLPPASVIKLYNSGNFFDGKAIPKTDYEAIANLLRDYDHVIVENHPKLLGPFIEDFRQKLKGTFEIAMGLETIHPEVLSALNKQITKEDFKYATEYLQKMGIDVRAFILLNPPFLNGVDENIHWCIQSVEYAFKCGASVCTIIPVREGNGIMEKLKDQGHFIPPKLKALEITFERALELKKGRIFCDTWDLEKFSSCDQCFTKRKNRIIAMNLQQTVLPKVVCTC